MNRRKCHKKTGEMGSDKGGEKKQGVGLPFNRREIKVPMASLGEKEVKGEGGVGVFKKKIASMGGEGKETF